MKPFRSLSWGCGLQSTLLGELSARGEIDPLNLIIHADLGWERQKTLDIRDFYADRWRKMGMRVEVLRTGNIRTQGADEHIHIPFYTDSGAPIRRQCSRYFKINPVKRRLREILGFDPSNAPHPRPGAIEQWLGFTVDEWTRAKPSRVKFITHRWPLLEMKLDRQDCKRWFEDHDLPVPIKSACIGCPFRLASEWLDMRTNAPGEWAQAIAFDEANRNNPLALKGSTADELYIYKAPRTALQDADLEGDAKRERRKYGTQLPMFGCGTGYCGT